MLTYPFIFIRPNQGDTASRPGRWPCEPAFESEPSRSAWWCSFVAPSHAMTKPAPTKCPCTEACRVHTRNEGIAEGSSRRLSRKNRRVVILRQFGKLGFKFLGRRRDLLQHGRHI